MKAKLPVVYSSTSDSSIVLDADCGVHTPSGNVQALTGNFLSFQKLAPSQLSQFGLNGHEYLSQYHDYSYLTSSFLSMLYRRFPHLP